MLLETRSPVDWNDVYDALGAGSSSAAKVSLSITGEHTFPSYSEFYKD